MPKPGRAQLKLSKERRQTSGRRARLKGLGGGLLGGALGLYLAWLLAWPQPQSAGRVGAKIALVLQGALGRSAWFLPLSLVGILARKAARKDAARRSLLWVSLAAALAFAAALLGLLAALFGASPVAWGGAVGNRLQGLLVNVFGAFGAFLVAAPFLLVALNVLYGLDYLEGVKAVGRLLRDDFNDWRRDRQSVAQKLREAKAAAALEKPAPMTSAPVSASSSSSKPSPRLVPAAAESAESEPNSGKPSRHAPADAAQAAPKRRPPDPASPFAGYAPPSADLLDLPKNQAGSGKPPSEELDTTSRRLEKTLHDFGISAAVVGVTPGPVITRYELEPAAGVKVSSIVARESDIALALKAKGIRLLAPIPGKGAVGVEIPNPRPAFVVLRELLERGALGSKDPLTSFILGLSADGEQRTADLQKMPHLLVAGATNSGKSVFLHVMILSILYRARPDELKFVMIDPKRLEMTFYSGIPHLFDPTASPENASVITSAKHARQALDALVRFMDARYEKFAKWGVRNIDSYNQEADRRGEPREYFVIVVIDELADLMLLSRDSVETAIQRLAQMARAVGIHLVLSTQRPSVDVITGVIKANLPCRVALQVISRIDSKVILDSSGAESLQGRGDLLFLAAGAQKPERCQGAYVSEEEIRRVTAHLVAQGGPSYAPWEAAPSALSADLGPHGVAPEDFARALKLIIERRRVSQDLLKSQFGSSARATNLLSLLEVKGLIHKPDGSNRWEIRFDQIEDCLKKNFSSASGTPAP